jgi:hypothetical protein
MRREVRIRETQNFQIFKMKSVRRASLPDRPDLLLVCQRQFAVSRAPQSIKTTGYNVCIIVSFYDKGKKLGALAHFDLNTDVAESFEKVIIPALQKNSFNLKNTQVRIVGGLSRTSDKLRQQVRDQLLMPGRRMRVVEIELTNVGKQGLVLDTDTGRIYDLIELIKSGGDTAQRYEQMIRQIMEQNPLLLDVSQT